MTTSGIAVPVPAPHSASDASGTRVLRQLVDAAVLQATSEPRSQYRRLAAGIERLVLDGRIGAGVRFPSERRVAQALGCSRVTVTAALDLLRERGLLISRTGAGSWTAIPPGPAGASGAWSSRAQGADVDIDLSAAQQAVPPELLSSAVEAAASRLPAHLDQRSPDLQGLRDLRRLVADGYAVRGLPTRPEQVLITCGAQQAFDLVLRTHLRPHDRVVVDDPTYPGLIDVLRRGGHRADGVPVDEHDGWRPADLLAAYATGRARLGIHVFDHHNPTGQRLADQERADLAAVCERHDAVLVVDETLVDLADAADTDARPLPMAAHLPSAISIGSLSKTHWSGLRIAWVRADRRMMRRLADAHATYTQGTPLLDQLVAVELLHDTEPHLIALRQRLSGQRQALVAALATALPAWKPNRPAGGVSLWVTLPDDVSARALVQRSPSAGVRLAAGSAFSPQQQHDARLRLPYVLPAADLEGAVGRIARLVASGQAAPSRRRLTSIEGGRERR